MPLRLHNNDYGFSQAARILSMDEAPPFRYGALNDPTRNIRLLKLLDTNDNPGHLACQLAVFNIDGALPAFAAISYTWGLSQRTESININGRPFQVRRAAWELLVAMKRFRSDTIPPPAHLWIDSICINQGNLRERSLQVQLMRKLYSTAKVVVVWLGTPTPSSDLAMQRLAALTQQQLQKKDLRSQTDLVLGPYQSAGTSTLYGPNARGFDFAYRGDPNVLKLTLDAKIGQSILDLFRRRYWHRIWVIQEVLLAKDVLLLCGSKSIEWSKLTSFFGGLEYQRLVEGLRFHGSTRSSQIMKTSAYKFVRERSYFESHPRLKAQGASISDLLQSFGNFECADKRDKIYGILGLSGDVFDVNYAKSLPQLHNEVLQRVVRTAQMDSVSKAEAFSRGLAAALGVGTASEQLIKASDLFYTPPRTLRWTDPRPFWETEFASALPQSYLHHLTSMLSLSMTPARAGRYSSLASVSSIDQGSTSHDAVASILADQFLSTLDSVDADSVDVSSVSVQADDGTLPARLFNVEIIDAKPVPSPSYIDFHVALRPRGADDSDIRPEVTDHVDYLSYEWDMEDLHANWKHISAQKDLRSGRVENAAWRTWNKIFLNRSTISPESLNWSVL